MERILILGAGGMLGHKLVRRWAGHLNLAATVRSSVPDPRIARLLPASAWHCSMDVRDNGRLGSILADLRPDVVVNCVGVVKQRIQTDDVLMVEINSLLPHQLARLCDEIGSRLIHLSTDCVYSGRRGGYTEADLPDPQDFYGRSKLAGEPRADHHLTIRTSMIGWELSTSQGLAEWFLQQRGGTVSGFTHAIYSGLTTEAMADVLAAVIRDHPKLGGTYHIASEPISKHDLLGVLNEGLGLGIHIIQDDELDCDRSLDASRFLRDTGIRIPAQREMLNALVMERRYYDDVADQ